MDIVNAVLLVEGCVRSSIKVKDIVTWVTILNAMEKPSPLLTSSIVYRGISCVRKMDADESEGQKFLRSLWEQTVEAEVVLDESDICPAIYSMQTLNANSPITKKFLKLFADSIDLSKGTFPSKTLCSAVFGLKKMKAIPEVKVLIAALARKIASGEVFYHPVNICIALNGLQGMDDSSVEVRGLLTALMDKSIGADEQGIDKAGDREISMAMFGLQRMGSKQSSSKRYFPSDSKPEVLRVLNYIGDLLDSYNQPFESRRLGFAVMGISGLSSEIPEVQVLVGKLAKRAEGAWGDLNSQELSMCLHGLAGLKSDSYNVRQLISAMVPLVKRCSSLTTNDARSAMYGLQGMHSSSKEVNELISAFGDLYERSDIHFTTSYDASTALYSMQDLSSTVPSSRRLMSLIASSISTVQGRYEGRDIAMALYGMKEFSSQNEETLKVLNGLNPFIRDFKGTFNVQNVAGCLQGLQKMRSGPKQVDALAGYLAPIVASTEGYFNSRGLCMALTGLQGLDSKQPNARALIESLAIVMEKSESSFTGFEDFHQISSAINGLGGMSTEYPEVRRLVDSLARLLKPLSDQYELLINTAASKATITSTATGAVPTSVSTGLVNDKSSVIAPKRQWQQGKGVVVTTPPPIEYIVVEDNKVKHHNINNIQTANQKATKDRLIKMLKDAPKPEKVGMALFGMQGLSSRYDSVRALMDVLLPFVKNMPAPTGKVLGMALQGFKSCGGRPTGSHAEVLSILAKKLPGWSTKREERGRDVNGRRINYIPTSDVKVTLRSALWGISKLDRQTPPVREVLKALAAEVLYWDPSTLDSKTSSSLTEVYKGGDIEKEPEVRELLHLIKQYSSENKIVKNDIYNIQNDEEKYIDNIIMTKKIHIDNVVSSFDSEMAFDQVEKYYNQDHSVSSSTPVSLSESILGTEVDLISDETYNTLPILINEIALIERTKISRKLKIEARQGRQEKRKLELELLPFQNLSINADNSNIISPTTTITTPITIYPSSSSSTTFVTSPSFSSSSRSYASSSPSFSSSSTLSTTTSNFAQPSITSSENRMQGDNGMGSSGDQYKNKNRIRDKQYHSPRANIEDSPNRGKKWIPQSQRESVASTSNN